MTAKNDITGDSIKSKILSQQGRDNWDAIFGKKEKVDEDGNDEQCLDTNESNSTE